MMPEIVNADIFIYFTIILFAAIVIRYFIAAGIFYWYFYLFESEKWHSRRLNPSKTTNPSQYRREIYWSLLSSVVFALIGTMGIWLFQNGYTVVYTEWSCADILYMPLSLLCAMAIHETYYYWLHRWMHKPGVFKIVHKVHHNSIVTSPWTAFSFHPLEALIEALVIPVIIMIIPMHAVVLGFYLLIMTVSSIVNHLDIEIYPEGFKGHWLGKWLIGATHHHFHHKEFRSNYGLYFTWWDRIMKTESPNYTGKNKP